MSWDVELPGMARHTDPDTAHTAAIIAKGKAGDNRALALAHLSRYPTTGLTDFQLADLCGIGQTSIGKRRGELVQLGYVKRATDLEGRNLRGLSPTMSPCAVWCITPGGLQAHRSGQPITYKK